MRALLRSERFHCKHIRSFKFLSTSRCIVVGRMSRPRLHIEAVDVRSSRCRNTRTGQSSQCRDTCTCVARLEIYESHNECSPATTCQADSLMTFDINRTDVSCKAPVHSHSRSVLLIPSFRVMPPCTERSQLFHEGQLGLRVFRSIVCTSKGQLHAALCPSGE